MTQRGVEIALGRLATDESIRSRFHEAPARVLNELIAMGVELDGEELRALESLEPCAIQAFARALDARLQKAVLVDATSYACGFGPGEGAN
jgi:hypothetical protein